ncbi:MAG: hypothetical protein KGD57_09015 [Candidatus Lokiarchaeota archaeon]|nr:hypothetical protein [Candidatus Lokiarchaeota archaeon]
MSHGNLRQNHQQSHLCQGQGSFLYTPRYDTRTFVPTEKFDFISGVEFPDGKASICSGSDPQCVITNLSYLDFDETSKKMSLASNHPGVDVESIKESTGFDLIISKDITETKPPSIREIKLLREKVDPLSIRKLNVLDQINQLKSFPVC